MSIELTAQAQLRLLQLVSPALPVGAFAYSQGLEQAVEDGLVSDEAGAVEWIIGLLSHPLARLDLPVLARLYPAWHGAELDAVDEWNRMLLAMRESAELYAEDLQLGRALTRLLRDIEAEASEGLAAIDDVSYACAFAFAAAHWGVTLRDSLSGYAWSWCENQVAAAIKLVPLGQTAGQRILGRCVEAIPSIVEQAMRLEDEAIGGIAPAAVLASMRHETQYSRLFRS